MDEIGVLKLPFFSAFVEGMKLNWNVTKGTVVGLFTIIREAARLEMKMSLPEVLSAYTVGGPLLLQSALQSRRLHDGI
jgi:hypothetical protein